MRVFVFQHEHELDGCDEVKFIGVYSSEERARAAVDRARALSGFCDYPDGFSVDPYEVDMDHWTEGFVTVAVRRETMTSGGPPPNRPLERAELGAGGRGCCGSTRGRLGRLAVDPRLRGSTSGCFTTWGYGSTRA